MTDPTPTARELIERARSGHDPSTADEARVRAALHARVLADPLLISANGAHALAGAGKLSWGKLALALGLGGAVVGAVVLSQGLGSREPARGARQASAAASVSARVQPPVTAQGVASAPNPSVSGPSTEAATSSGAASASQKHPVATASVSASVSPGDMQLEISGLGRAQQLLHAGSATQALSALEQLAQQVPHGALMEERDATRALAQCALARSSSVANAFLARYPRSVHAARVRSACTTD